MFGFAGKTVGFRIRLEATASPRTPLQFVTYGILVRMLTSGELTGVTHIVLDEIHERDKFADFAIVLLLDLLRDNPDVRLILMSATLQVRVCKSPLRTARFEHVFASDPAAC